MTGIKIATFIGITSTLGIIAQVTPTVPEDLKSWPATAILGLITLASLSIVFFVLKKLFAAIATLDKTASGIQELNARMNRRPCIMDKD